LRSAVKPPLHNANVAMERKNGPPGLRAGRSEAWGRGIKP
jgi:hypothetical protein